MRASDEERRIEREYRAAVRQFEAARCVLELAEDAMEPIHKRRDDEKHARQDREWARNMAAHAAILWRWLDGEQNIRDRITLGRRDSRAGYLATGATAINYFERVLLNDDEFRWLKNEPDAERHRRLVALALQRFRERFMEIPDTDVPLSMNDWLNLEMGLTW